MRLGKEDYESDPVAWEETEKYISEWENNKRNGLGIAFMAKEMGVGKTFLASLVAREVIKMGDTVYFANFRDIVSLYQIPYEDRIEEETKIHNCTLLILDEVVKTYSDRQKDFFGEKFEELIRNRSNYNRVTIITTNLETNELESNYPRTFSLLSAKQKMLKVNRSDIRKEGIWEINKALAERGEIRPIQ